MDHHHPSSRFPPQPPSYQQAHDRHDPRLHAVSTTYAASATGVGPPPMAYPYPPQAPYHAPDHRRELGPPGPPEGPPPQLGRYGEAASRHSRTSVAMLSPPYPARDARDENRLPRRNSYNFAPTHNDSRPVASPSAALEPARHHHSLSHPSIINTSSSMAHYYQDSTHQGSVARSPVKSHRMSYEPVRSTGAPTPFNPRNMAPPSPRQHYQVGHGNGPPPPQRPGPLTSSPPRSFSSNRDLPSLHQNHRPTSGMSISSMIEPDPNPPQRAPSSSMFNPGPSSRAPQQPSHAAHTGPLSPHTARAQEHRARQDYQGSETYGRLVHPADQERTAMASSHPISLSHASDQLRYGEHQKTQVHPQDRRRDDGSIASGDARHYNPHFPHFQHAPDGMRPRSNSQPAGPGQQHSTSSANVRSAPAYDPVAQYKNAFSTSHIMPEHGGVVPEYRGHAPDRERAESMSREERNQALRASMLRPHTPTYHAQHGQDRRVEVQSAHRDVGWNSAPSRYDHFAGPPQLRTPPSRVEHVLFDGQQRLTASAQYSPPGPSDYRSNHQVNRAETPQGPNDRDQHAQYPSPTVMRSSIAAMQSNDEPMSDRSYGQRPANTPAISQNPTDPSQRGSDPFNHTQPQPSRSLLIVHPEAARKGGRNSPLPQAVQGAQIQLSGPGDEPGIKNEFGRMFSGIGTGVGSALSSFGPAPNEDGAQGNGVSSPKPDEARNATPVRVPPDGKDVNVASTGTRGVKRTRKPRGDGSKLNGDGADGTATSNAKGAKRGRHTHHHHHHQHGHHHHHHHPKNEERVVSPLATHTRLGQDLATDGLPRSLTPPQAASHQATSSGHHHYHHHHHHGSKNSPLSAKGNNIVIHQTRKPVVTVDSHQVMQIVKHLPMQHLGSMTYSPRLSVACLSGHSKFSFETTPKPFPRFESNANCTFTIRVPRIFLTPRSREEVTRRRALWGTDIYTDDSDVLAAAIHQGWVRGDWGEEVDISLLDLGPDSPQPSRKDGKPDGIGAGKNTGSKLVLEAPPDTGPMLPPDDKDVHITVRIFPPLQSYASTVSRGLKSRGWGSNHDGMSFKIERIEWVDPTWASREERGGKARRARMRDLLRAQRAVERAVKLKNGAQVSEGVTWGVAVVG